MIYHKLNARDNAAKNKSLPLTKSKAKQLLDFVTASQDKLNESESGLSRYLNKMTCKTSIPSNGGLRIKYCFQIFAGLARKYLSIPGTSMSSEKIFSTTGIIVNKLRGRLSSVVIDQIILLNKK